MDDARVPGTGGGDGAGEQVRAAGADAQGDAHPCHARLVADHALDGLVVTDAEGHVEWVNAAFERMSGHPLADLRGRAPADILQGPGTDRATLTEIRAALSERRPLRTEILYYRRDGRPFWAEMRLAPVFDAAGRHTHFVSVDRDITDRREREERARTMSAAEEYHQAERRLLVEMSEWLYSAKSQDELLAVVALAMPTLMPEADGALYVYASERDTLVRRTGWGDSPLAEHVTPDECWALRRGRAYHFGAQTIQLPCGHAQGYEHPSFCLPIIAQGDTIGLMHLVFSVFRLTEAGGVGPHAEFLRRRWATALTCAEQISLAIANVRLRDELERRSMRDQLTGLCNRRWLLEEGARMLRRAAHQAQPLSLLVIDVDHFKAFNDSYGHDAGDRVLREVATVISEEAAEPAASARIGGEEFAVILPGAGRDAALGAAEGLRARIAGLALRHLGRPLPAVTVSIGQAEAPRDGGTLPDLLGTADRALYAAKEAGRNRVMASARPAPAPGPAPAVCDGDAPGASAAGADAAMPVSAAPQGETPAGETPSGMASPGKRGARARRTSTGKTAR